MPITPDAVTIGPVVTTGTGSVTFSHTCTGDDRYLIVAASKANSAVLAAEYNGVAMTELSSAYDNGVRLMTWGMVNPPAGTHDVRVFLPGGGTTYPTMVAISRNGVDQATPVGTVTTAPGSSAAGAIASTLEVGDLGVTVMMAQNDATTATITSDWTTELANFAGGTGSVNSARMVAAEQWGRDITLDVTLSASTDWQMATIPLKPADPPTIYTGYMIIPTTYNLPADMGGGTVTLDASSQAMAEAEANTIVARTLNYSSGMGVLDMHALVWSTTAVTEDQYSLKTGEHSGWYVHPDKMVASILDSISINLYNIVDVVAVYTDPDATTLDESNVTGLASARGWWSRIDASGLKSGPHEFAHALERHLRTQGYSNFPVCVANGNGTSTSLSIHCGNEYGYSSNSDDEWLTDFFSGTTTDGTGVDAAGWALPTILEYQASFPPDIDITDSFTDTTGTALGDHAPETGGAWQRVYSNANLLITPAGRLRTDGTSSSSPSVYRNLALPTNPDMSVACDIYVADGLAPDSVGVCARMDPGGAEDFYHARANPGAAEIQLYRFSDALGNSSLGSVTWNRAIGQTYRLELRCEGDRIRVFLDGVQIMDVTDTTIPDAGYAGIRVLGTSTDTSGLHIDNLNATVPPAETFTSHLEFSGHSVTATATASAATTTDHISIFGQDIAPSAGVDVQVVTGSVLVTGHSVAAVETSSFTAAVDPVLLEIFGHAASASAGATVETEPDGWRVSGQDVVAEVLNAATAIVAASHLAASGQAVVAASGAHSATEPHDLSISSHDVNVFVFPFVAPSGVSAIRQELTGITASRIPVHGIRAERRKIMEV